MRWTPASRTVVLAVLAGLTAFQLIGLVTALVSASRERVTDGLGAVVLEQGAAARRVGMGWERIRAACGAGEETVAARGNRRAASVAATSIAIPSSSMLDGGGVPVVEAK